MRVRWLRLVDARAQGRRCAGGPAFGERREQLLALPGAHARATGAGVSTVSAWLHRTRCPRGQRAERLVELSAIIERLAAVLEHDYVPVWLNRPLAALDHRKPIDVLAAGGYEQLSQIVAGLEAPTFS